MHNPAPEGMEQLHEVVRRTGSFMESIKGAVGGKNILISTHAIAMKGILEYLTPESKGSYWSKYIGHIRSGSQDFLFHVSLKSYTGTMSERGR